MKAIPGCTPIHTSTMCQGVRAEYAEPRHTSACGKIRARHLLNPNSAVAWRWHAHAAAGRCYANRDIAKLVKEAGLHIALAVRSALSTVPFPERHLRLSKDERAHFGTTYKLVCTKTPLKQDGIGCLLRVKMSRLPMQPGAGRRRMSLKLLHSSATHRVEVTGQAWLKVSFGSSWLRGAHKRVARGMGV